MKKLLLLLIIIPFLSSAQKHGQDLVDSLKAIVQTSKIDTIRIKALNVMSSQLKDMAKYDSATLCANTALSSARKSMFKTGIARALFNIGRIVEAKGNHTEALKNYLASLKISLEIGDNICTGDAYNNIGGLYYDQSNYSEALKNYLASLKTKEKTADKEGIAICYNNIGTIYDYYRNYPDALRYCFAALKIHEELGNKKGIAVLNYNLGEIYFNQGSFSEALKHLLTALKLSKETGDKDGIAAAYNYIGHIYLNRGDYDVALQNYQASIAIMQELQNKQGIAQLYRDFGNLYVKQKKAKEGRQWLGKSLSLAKQIDSKEDIMYAYQRLSEADSSLGDYKSAYLHHKLYLACRDSLTNEESNRKIVQQLLQYDFDKKEAETKAEHDREILRQKLIRNGILAGFILIFCFSLVVFRQKKKIEKGKQLSDKLLLNILPAEVAEELKKTGTSKAKSHLEVSVIFTDFVSFTLLAEKLSAEQIVTEIDACFKAFDNIIDKYGMEKIKTIGDAYMAAAGLPMADEHHAVNAVEAAIEMDQYMQTQGPVIEGERLTMRIGINSGPVVAGIVGIRKFAYDIWGDTVNTAARIEQHGEAGKINISGSTYQLVKHKFDCEYRGKIQAKNKGEIDMYYVAVATSSEGDKNPVTSIEGIEALA